MLPDHFAGLDEILKVPKEKQAKITIDNLQVRRKTLGDIFFDKTKTFEERNAVYDELVKINKYFGYKEIFKLKEKGSGRTYKPITAADRETNCEAFIAYMQKKFKNIPEQALVDYIPLVWANTK